MNDRIISAADMMNFASSLISKNENELPGVWRKVVSKIGKKNEEDDEALTLGEKLAANSHVVDFKNGILLVEANHSGWIQYLKFNEKFILQGLKWSLPDLKISSLAFRVAGSKVSLKDSYDDLVKKDKQEMAQKIEQQEKELSKLGKNQPEKKEGETELPDELKERFARLRQSMLTNSKE